MLPCQKYYTPWHSQALIYGPALLAMPKIWTWIFFLVHLEIFMSICSVVSTDAYEHIKKILTAETIREMISLSFRRLLSKILRRKHEFYGMHENL